MKRDSLLLKRLLFIFTVCIGDITCYIFSCCFEVNNCFNSVEVLKLQCYINIVE